MPSIGEMIGHEIIEEVAPGAEIGVEEVVEERQSLFDRFKFDIWADNSEKTIESYQEHVFNFDKKESTSRIIKSLEDMGVGLNKAIINLVMGLMMKWKELKQ